MNPHSLHYRSDRHSGEPGSIGFPIVCTLFVHKAIMAPLSAPWRLLWAESADADTFVHAEGECSARCFRTMRQAIAYGIHAYGETAIRFKD
jgi:hypothetical protein